MGKRSNFPRYPQDAYETPAEAVEPLLLWLAAGTSFVEPCAGQGALTRRLTDAGHKCIAAFDLPVDARTNWYGVKPGVVFITNPPWRREVLHDLIGNLSNQARTWLLFDADWVHTRQSTPYLPRLKMIISVGRVRWIPDSPYDGKDNCAWHLFDLPGDEGIQFIGRIHV